jgi:hypothetical protein
MAANPNAQLIKLAMGVASVAAIAGITGRFSAGAPAQTAEQMASAADGPAPQRQSTGVQGQSIFTAPAPGLTYGDDEEEGKLEHEGDHERREHGGSFLFAQPGATAQTQSRSQPQPLPRARTRRS